MQALVLGATGAIGKDLVEQLLQDNTFDRVDIFVRREVNIPSVQSYRGGMFCRAARMECRKRIVYLYT